jgi:hypothetical protein
LALFLSFLAFSSCNHFGFWVWQGSWDRAESLAPGSNNFP